MAQGVEIFPYDDNDSPIVCSQYYGSDSPGTQGTWASAAVVLISL